MMQPARGSRVCEKCDYGGDELIESIKTAARAAHFRRFSMFVFVMPLTTAGMARTGGGFLPLATRRLFTCHSQKTMRHNDLDADEPLGE
jgi:hypothetical protein